MLLTIDIGNTNIKTAVYDGDMLYFISRMATDSSRMEDQYAIELLNLLRVYNIDPVRITGAVISSVVPRITGDMQGAIKKLFGVDALIVSYDLVKDGLDVTIEGRDYTGADLIADCYAAKQLFPAPCIVIDMGTATKLLVLDEKARMIGGCILAGLGISMDALATRAALLSDVELKTPPHVIGNNTVRCIQSGMVFGTAALLDGLIDKIECELGAKCTIVATGGFAQRIIPSCEREIHYSETFLLDGLRLIYAAYGDGGSA